MPWRSRTDSLPDASVSSIFVSGVVLCLASGCGTPGAPMPPALELPRPVNDLGAERKGDRVLLSWAEPVDTTEGRSIRHPGLTLVCRSVSEYPMRSAASR